MSKPTEEHKSGSVFNVVSSKAQLAATPEVGVEELEYEPRHHRDQKKALGTFGALFHMIKGSLGSGILSMPVAFKNGGLWVSLLGIFFVGVICTHCVEILVYCSQTLSKKLRLPSLGYAATAEAAFFTGPARLHKYSAIAREIVDGFLMITCYMGNAVYIVFITATFKQVLEAHVDLDLNPRYYVLLISVIVIPVGSIRHLKFLVPFSFFAIVFLLIGCGFVLYDIFSDLPPLDSRPAFTSLQKLPLFYATVLFALEGIGTVLPIENVMKSPQHFLGSVGVLNISMGLLIVMYAVIGFLGYLHYGDATAGSVTLNLGTSLSGEVVKVLVALNVLFSFGLCAAVPAEVCWRKLEPRVKKESQTKAYYIMRVLLVIGCLLLAAGLPDLESIVGLCGAICYSTLGLLFPSIIELITFWHDKQYMGAFHWRLFKNIFLMIMWLIALTAGTSASISKIYETFYQSG